MRAPNTALRPRTSGGGRGGKGCRERERERERERSKVTEREGLELCREQGGGDSVSGIMQIYL